jgi:hypothetical protein
MADGKYAQYVTPFYRALTEYGDMTDAYQGSVVNPPLFFDPSIYKGDAEAKMWVEVLHTYAPGGSFGTPLMPQMASGHKHEFDEVFIFLGSNPDDITDLGGTVETWLGEGDEAEKFMLTKSTCVYIPAGVPHSTTVYREVKNPDQPIILVVVAMKGDYQLEEENTKLPTGFVQGELADRSKSRGGSQR